MQGSAEFDRRPNVGGKRQQGVWVVAVLICTSTMDAGTFSA